MADRNPTRGARATAIKHILSPAVSSPSDFESMREALMAAMDRGRPVSDAMREHLANSTDVDDYKDAALDDPNRSCELDRPELWVYSMVNGLELQATDDEQLKRLRKARRSVGKRVGALSTSDPVAAAIESGQDPREVARLVELDFEKRVAPAIKRRSGNSSAGKVSGSARTQCTSREKEVVWEFLERRLLDASASPDWFERPNDQERAAQLRRWFEADPASLKVTLPGSDRTLVDWLREGRKAGYAI
jgi:hypothetical protein